MNVMGLPLGLLTTLTGVTTEVEPQGEDLLTAGPKEAVYMCTTKISRIYYDLESKYFY